MAVQSNYVLLHLSLSRRVVSDLPRLTDWGPIEFYAAIEDRTTAEGCMNRISAGDVALTGWRLFSSPHQTEAGQIVQWVREFERLFVRSEAIAYARTAAREKFAVSSPLKNCATDQQFPQELLKLLGGAS